MPERFPRAKYRRQLYRIAADISSWVRAYEEAAATAEPEWLQGRFLDRAAILRDAVQQVSEAAASVNALPDRLSR